jgi:hypothetical protein
VACEAGAMAERGDREVEERLERDIAAYHAAALVHAAVRLGLPDEMGELRWSPQELGGALNLDPEPLHRFLRALCTLGICEESGDGAFVLTRAGHALRKGAQSRLREKALIVVEQYWRPWADLLHSLQTGRPAFEHVFGMPVSDWRRDNAAQGAIFHSYLAKQTLAEGHEILEALDLDGAAIAADIGGGHGGLIAAILRARPGIAGILFDRSETVATAGSFLDLVDMADRLQRVGGDVLVEIPVRADLYLLKGVLQQWGDAGALAILRNCRKAMPEGARLVIIERRMPEFALDDPAAIMLDLHMMAITGGRARTLAEFDALLSQAGLERTRVVPTRSGTTLIEAVPT